MSILQMRAPQNLEHPGEAPSSSWLDRLTAWIGLIVAFGMTSTSIHGQQPAQEPRAVPIAIQQAAGADSRVDYQSLTRYGPWDDRNYQLTRAEVDLLQGDEKNHNLVPAFYRVQWRKLFLERGVVLDQYPRSMYPRFLAFYGGFLINGQLYKNADRKGAPQPGARLRSAFGVDAADRAPDYRVLATPSETPMDFLLAKSQISLSPSEHRVSFNPGRAESAVAIRPTDSQYVIAGANGSGFQEMYYSEDGGTTWNLAGGLFGNTCCDPTVAWSSDGTKAYTATLGGGQNYFYRSGDNGQTWSDLTTETPGDPRRELGSGTDKEYIHVDTHPASPYLDTIHMTWHEGGTMKFARSTDFGHTWLPTISFNQEPVGIGSDITTDANGHVYYFYPNLDPAINEPSDIRLLKSTDGGATFGDPGSDRSTVVAGTEVRYEFEIPIMDTRKTWVHISTDADVTDSPHSGNIYAAWTDSTGPRDVGNPANNHARIRVAVSTDAGASWNVQTPHPTDDSLTVDRFHPWLKVDRNGSVHVIYYDTSESLDRLSLDLFHVMSLDGGATWEEPERLTSESSPEIQNSFEWGDYNGLDIVGDKLIAIYTDNRDENAGGGDSRDVYAIRRLFIKIFEDGFESGDFSRWSDACTALDPCPKK